MKKILVFTLLTLTFHLVIAQVSVYTNKFSLKKLSDITSAKAKYRNHTLLMAYMLEPPKFNFDFSIKGNQNPDTSKNTRICTCSTPLNISPILILALSRKRSFKVNSLTDIQREWIKSINIFKDSTQVSAYGQEGQNGVVLITVNDNAYPSVYRQLKRMSKPYLISKNF